MSKNLIMEKLMNVQRELKAPKGQYNDFGRYKYRSAEDIVEAVKPIASKYGALIILSDEIAFIGDRIYIKATATFCDVDTGEKIKAEAFAREPESKKGMDASQITGSCSSYARKYALNGLFCIDDTKDSDYTNVGKNDEIEGPKSPKKMNTGKRMEQSDKPLSGDGSELLTDSQRKLLYASASGISKADMKIILDGFGYESSKEIKRKDVDGILNTIKNYKFKED